MEEKLKKINGFIPALTAFVVLIAFLFYMVAYLFIKGLDSGYGITSIVGSQEELVANGLLLFMGLVGKIAIEAFSLLFSYWKIYLYAALGVLIIGAFLGLFEKYTANTIPTNIFRKPKLYLNSIALVLTVIYIFIIFPLTAFEKGKNYAHNKIKEINEKGCEVESEIWETCSTISYDTLLKTVTLEGYVLDKKGREVTIYLPKEKILRTFIIPSNAVIERRFTSNKTN